MTSLDGASAALEALYWRAEILQAMYWMRGEGLAASVTAERLADFLGSAPAKIEAQMRLLVEDGLLEAPTDSGLGYALTERGRVEGGRSFQDEFASLTHPAHYECAPGCWCHDPNHAGEPCPSLPAPEKPKPREDPPDRDA